MRIEQHNPRVRRVAVASAIVIGAIIALEITGYGPQFILSALASKIIGNG